MIRHLSIAATSILVFSFCSFAQKNLPDKIIPFTYNLLITYQKGLYGLKETGSEGKEIIPAKYSSYTIHDFDKTLAISVIEFNGNKLPKKYITSGKKEITDEEYMEIVRAHTFKVRISTNPYSSYDSVPKTASEVTVADSLDDNVTFQKVITAPWFRFENQDAVTYIKSQINKSRDSLKLKDKGLVTISFIVEKDGTVSTPAVIVNPSEKLSKLSLDILQRMPKWQPAVQGGRAVRDRQKLDFEW